MADGIRLGISLWGILRWLLNILLREIGGFSVFKVAPDTLLFCKDKFDFLVSRETLGKEATKEAFELDGEFITLEDIKRENSTHE